MIEENSEIYSLLVPLGEERLLIPRSNVMEVSALKPLDVYNGAVPWLLGSMEWENAMVPVISFEGTCGEDVPKMAGRARIVLFRCLTDALNTRAFGVISQGFPQLVRVSEDALVSEEREIDPQVPVICQVRMANQSLLIPDIEKLEQLIADAISVST